jgi:hypothetical protein
VVKLFTLRKRVQAEYYQHTTSELPGPGAESVGFVRAYPDPPVDLIGAATMQRKSLSPLQPHQVFSNLAVPHVGPGGFVTGVSGYFTPLSQNDVTQTI